MSDLKDAALLYASLGYKVFPLVPRGKSPAIKGWQDAATTDPEQVRRWWRENQNYNVGIKTGGGLCVIDVDDKPDKHPVLGSDMLRDWELEHGEISETVCCKTPTGGMHYYFNVGEARIDGCQSDSIFIDLRCDGNLIVAPPSIHPDTGTAYMWDISPEDMEPAIANDTDKACIQWIHDNRKGTGGGGGKAEIPEEPVKEGEGRNRFLYEQGCSVRGRGADEQMVEIWLRDLNGAKCKPPLDDAELMKIVRSVCSKKAGMSDEAKRTSQQRKRFDHAGIADKLIADNGACFIDGMPAIRHGDVYRIGWREVNREVILLDRSATKANQREVQHYLTMMAEQKQQSPPHLIAFRNGVLNAKTMELSAFSPDHVIPNIIPHDWDEDAECPEVDAILHRVSCGDDGVYLNLIQVFGVCMYRSSEFTQSAILLGDGSNGKSTYIRMIQALLGNGNISSLGMSMLGKQFLTCQLAGKLANLGSEISNEFKNGDLLSVFKELVDGNRMHADVKGVEGFDFESYATLVLCANEFPRLADYTDGMMRRLFPIEFNAHFDKADADYDPQIAKKVRTEKACSYMAKLGVLGLQQVFIDNGFTPNAGSERRLAEIRTDNDNTLAWIEDRGWTADTISGQQTSEKYRDYKEWCTDYGYQYVSHKKFTRLVNKNIGTECRKMKVNGYAKNCFGKR